LRPQDDRGVNHFAKKRDRALSLGPGFFDSLEHTVGIIKLILRGTEYAVYNTNMARRNGRLAGEAKGLGKFRVGNNAFVSFTSVKGVS